MKTTTHHSCLLTRRQSLALGFAGSFCAITATAHAAAPPPVVVELFTSQGCSSCPPADALLAEIKNHKDIIAMSLNVDYWDYLGWRDTLAQHAYTKRQQDYAKARGDNKVYTPQMIINGRRHLVGSDRASLKTAIAEAKALNQQNFVPITMRSNNKNLQIDIAAAPNPQLAVAATLWIVKIASEIPVKIARGENRGQTLNYHNVALDMIPARMWNGEAAKFALPRAQFFTDRANLCAAFLQIENSGPIIGAVSLFAATAS